MLSSTQHFPAGAGVQNEEEHYKLFTSEMRRPVGVGPERGSENDQRAVTPCL